MKKIAFCFDLDGTITKDEILPAIAKSINIEEEISILTKATINGILDFRQSFKLRVMLLSKVKISIVQQIVNNIRINDDIKQFITSNSDICYVVTGNLDCWVKTFIDTQLGCKSFTSIANYNNDDLLGITKILNKYDAISSLKNEYSTIVVIGDGQNDFPMFDNSDLSIAFGGVHEPAEIIKNNANLIIYSGHTLCKILSKML